MVDETQRWDGGYAAISSFGFGGANMHLVMKGRGGERIQLQTVVGGPSDSTDEDEDFSPEPGVDASITPLAARTPEGLVYLAKIVSEVRLSAGPGVQCRKHCTLYWHVKQDGMYCHGDFCCLPVPFLLMVALAAKQETSYNSYQGKPARSSPAADWQRHADSGLLYTSMNPALTCHVGLAAG